MAMHNTGLNEKFTFDKQEILRILEDNLEEHKKIVEEAKVGWQEATIKALDNLMDEINEDGTPRAMHFDAAPVDDYSDIYETFIMQLTMAKETELELDGDQFRKLIQDKWEWQGRFLHSNAAYSHTAALKLQ